MMTWEIAFILITVGYMVGCLILEIGRPEKIVFVTMVVFLITGIISTEDAVKGFSNGGLLTIALLFIIAGGIQKSDLTKYFYLQIIK